MVAGATMNQSLDPVIPPQEQLELRVRRGRVASVDLYEIKENELEILENGSPSGLYLNFSIFLISLAFGAITTIATATFANPLMQQLFLIIAVVGTLGGLLLLILWWRSHQSIAQVVRAIRARIPPDLARPASLSTPPDVEPKG
jgi:hypothetical protein